MLAWLTSVIALCLSLVATTTSPLAGVTERRVALVIGNSHYANTAPLPNPMNDAADVAASLRALGFEVLFKTDVNKHEMDLMLAQFARQATDADAALVFYAGHGMQFQGKNYIMPVDAELEDEISLKYQMTGLEDIRAALERAKGPKIMILDACRNNPLAERLIRSISGKTREISNIRGFTRPEPTRGMVIAYSTQADDVAQDGSTRNSPFTQALLTRIQEPGLEIGTMFRRIASDVYKTTDGKQLPELSISLLSDFYLNEAETDGALWERVRGSEDADTLHDFLIRFPTSPFATEAKLRLDLIERSAKDREARAQLEKYHPKPQPPGEGIAMVPSVTPPADPGALVRSIKIELQRVGCYSGDIDENWDSGAMKQALAGLSRYASLSPTQPSPGLLDNLKAKTGRLCPLQCPPGQDEENGHCQLKTCGQGEILNRSGKCVAHGPARSKPKAVAETAAPARSSRPKPNPAGRRCFSFGGKNYCE